MPGYLKSLRFMIESLKNQEVIQFSFKRIIPKRMSISILLYIPISYMRGMVKYIQCNYTQIAILKNKPESTFLTGYAPP
jgi:hypothetical protein